MTAVPFMIARPSFGRRRSGVMPARAAPGGRHLHAVAPHFALAAQHRGQVGQRRQVAAGADRPFARNQRQQAGVEQARDLQQQVDADAGKAFARATPGAWPSRRASAPASGTRPGRSRDRCTGDAAVRPPASAARSPCRNRRSRWSRRRWCRPRAAGGRGNRRRAGSRRGTPGRRTTAARGARYRRCLRSSGGAVEAHGARIIELGMSARCIWAFQNWVSAKNRKN
jgi:hypothetical protein